MMSVNVARVINYYHIVGGGISDLYDSFININYLNFICMRIYIQI